MWRATCEALGAVLVAPGEAGENEGYAWTMRERDAAIGALRLAMLRFNVDPDRVYATGVSRGGHLAWDVALRRPDRFAAIAPLIGCPRFQLVRGQNNLRFLENLVGVPIRDLQGSQDDPGVIENLHDAFARLAALGAKDAKLIEFPGRGHSFDFGAVDWVEFFEASRRDHDPDHVVFTCANLAEARAFWVEIVQLGRDVAENPRLDARAGEWERLDAAGQRRFVQERIDASTARIEVTRTEKGRYAAEERGVSKFRLLLAADDFERGGQIEVMLRGKKLVRRPITDPRIALCDYVERLDASFVPVAAVEIP
jgi:poly(3-hydroxybutyrate) depolymerase